MAKKVTVKSGKPAKKKTKSAPSVKTLVSATVAQMSVAATETKSAFQMLDRVLIEVKAAVKDKKPGTLSQATLWCGARLNEIQKSANAQRDEYKLVVAEHKAAGGDFEAGKIAITIDVTDKASPKWKEAAIAAQKRLCEVEGRPFNEDRYVKQIQSDSKTTTSTTVKIVESD